jgi:hypothetical protein
LESRIFGIMFEAEQREVKPEGLIPLFVLLHNSRRMRSTDAVG